MREIITLQLGQSSNHLGTHFWNAQESYFTYDGDSGSPLDHDVHFRPGVGADGTETYTPRTVIYDLKGGFGSMRKINALYEADHDAAASGLWSGKTVVHKQQPIEPSAYQESLETGASPAALSTDTVRYWSDYNRVFFHPRSIIQLNEYELNSSLMPFDKSSMGDALFSSLDKDHDIVDRDLRPFIEEADQMQGIQLMTGIDDAWAGFASRYLERLRDEYGKTPVWVWGLHESSTPALSREKGVLRLANKAVAITAMYSHASLLIPLSLPRGSLPRSLGLDRSSPWHVSALLAAAMESTSLYTRLKSSSSNQANVTSLGDVMDMLNVSGKQRIANMHMSPVVTEPLTHRQQQNGTDKQRGPSADEPAYVDDQPEADAASLNIDMDLSSLQESMRSDRWRSRRAGRRAHMFAQLNTFRGHDDSHPTGPNGQDTRSSSQQQPTVHQCRSELPYPIPDSHPGIFLDESGRPVRDPISIRTVLSTDSSITEKMTGLRHTVLRSIALEDREDMGNDLAEIADAYREGWSSGSDDDDDDDG